MTKATTQIRLHTRRRASKHDASRDARTREDSPTLGPFFIRKSFTGGDYWYVETAKIERLALFRREADAKRFAGLLDAPEVSR